jgi:hypothetical protein
MKAKQRLLCVGFASSWNCDESNLKAKHCHSRGHGFELHDKIEICEESKCCDSDESITSLSHDGNVVCASG